MRRVSQPQLEDILHRLGLHSGDGVLCHSALQYLGTPENGLDTYFSALDAVLDVKEETAAGTLAVPTFNFGFARGEAYDPQNTPSKGMGTLSEYIRMHPRACRTTHPMHSLAVIGKYRNELCAIDTLSAFDAGSVFERMLELDFKLLLLGADIQAVTMVHYSEQRAGVPYRYWKDFSGEVRTDKAWEKRTYRMYVRDLEIDAQLILQPIQKALQDQGLWMQERLNYGWICVCRLNDFTAQADSLLTGDPWCLVSKE